MASFELENYTVLAQSGYYKALKYSSRGNYDYWVAIYVKPSRDGEIGLISGMGMGESPFGKGSTSPFSGTNSAFLNSIYWVRPNAKNRVNTDGLTYREVLKNVCQNVAIPSGDYYEDYISGKNKVMSLDSSNCDVSTKDITTTRGSVYKFIVFGKVLKTGYNLSDGDPVLFEGVKKLTTDTDCYNLDDNLLDSKSGYVGNKKVYLVGIEGSDAILATFKPKSSNWFDSYNFIDDVNTGKLGDGLKLGLPNDVINWLEPDANAGENDFNNPDKVDYYIRKGKDGLSTSSPLQKIYKFSEYGDVATDYATNQAFWVKKSSSLSPSLMEQQIWDGQSVVDSQATLSYPTILLAKVPIASIEQYFPICEIEEEPVVEEIVYGYQGETDNGKGDVYAFKSDSESLILAIIERDARIINDTPESVNVGNLTIDVSGKGCEYFNKYVTQQERLQIGGKLGKSYTLLSTLQGYMQSEDVARMNACTTGWTFNDDIAVYQDSFVNPVYAKEYPLDSNNSISKLISDFKAYTNNDSPNLNIFDLASQEEDVNENIEVDEDGNPIIVANTVDNITMPPIEATEEERSRFLGGLFIKDEFGCIDFQLPYGMYMSVGDRLKQCDDGSFANIYKIDGDDIYVLAYLGRGKFDKAVSEKDSITMGGGLIQWGIPSGANKDVCDYLRSRGFVEPVDAKSDGANDAYWTTKTHPKNRTGIALINDVDWGRPNWVGRRDNCEETSTSKNDNHMIVLVGKYSERARQEQAEDALNASVIATPTPTPAPAPTPEPAPEPAPEPVFDPSTFDPSTIDWGGSFDNASIEEGQSITQSAAEEAAPAPTPVRPDIPSGGGSNTQIDDNVPNDIPSTNVPDSTPTGGGGVYDIMGCTDPNAQNYDPNATVDSGSCKYEIASSVDTTYTTTDSNYSDIDSLLDEYIDAANYAADELQDCNDKVKEYKELCKLDPNNADACESVSELEEYIKELQAELDTLSSQSGALEAFKGLIATRLSSTYGLNISQSSTNEQIVSAIETKLEGLKSDLSSKTKEYDDKVAQYDSLVAEEEELAQELEDALGENTADDAEIAKLKSDIADLEAANLALSGGENELNELIASLQNDVARLEGELKDADDGVTSANVAAVQAKLDDANKQITNMENYRNRLVALVSNYNNVSVSIGDEPIPNTLATMNLGDVYALANSYKINLLKELAKVGTSEAQVSGLESQVGGLTSDKEGLQNQLNDLQTQYDNLLQTSSNTSSEDSSTISGQEAELDRLEGEIQSLESQLETASLTTQSQSGTISELEGKVTKLNSDLETLKSQLDDSLEAYKTSKTNELNAEINTLVSEGVLSQGYALGLENLISDWSNANSEISRLEGELGTLSNSIESGTLTESGLLSERNELSSQLAQANTTISNQNTQLNNLIDDIESANSEIDQFNLFENKLKTALNTLEGKLTPLGYQKSSSFNGDGGFNPFGSNPTEFQKLMFRGMKARKAYLNMSGGKDKDYSNFASKDEDGDLVAPILKIGLIAGLAYVASKFLKK